MWSEALVGCELGPSTCARTRTWAKTNVIPRPLEVKHCLFLQAPRPSKPCIARNRAEIASSGGSGEDGRRHHAPHRGRGPELAAEPCGREQVGAGVTSCTFCTLQCSVCTLQIAPRLLGSICSCPTKSCQRSWRRLGRSTLKATSSRTTALTSTTQQTEIPKGVICTRDEQALKPDQRMCKFLALRLAFGNPNASDLRKAALSGSEHVPSRIVFYSVPVAHRVFLMFRWANSTHPTIRFPIFSRCHDPFTHVRRARFEQNPWWPSKAC